MCFKYMVMKRRMFLSYRYEMLYERYDWDMIEIRLKYFILKYEMFISIY